MVRSEKCLVEVEVKGDLRGPGGCLCACKQEAMLYLENVSLMPVKYQVICLEIISSIGNP